MSIYGQYINQSLGPKYKLRFQNLDFETLLPVPAPVLSKINITVPVQIPVPVPISVLI